MSVCYPSRNTKTEVPCVPVPVQKSNLGSDDDDDDDNEWIWDIEPILQTPRGWARNNDSSNKNKTRHNSYVE